MHNKIESVCAPLNVNDTVSGFALVKCYAISDYWLCFTWVVDYNGIWVNRERLSAELCFHFKVPNSIFRAKWRMAPSICTHLIIWLRKCFYTVSTISKDPENLLSRSCPATPCFEQVLPWRSDVSATSCGASESRRGRCREPLASSLPPSHQSVKRTETHTLEITLSCLFFWSCGL